MFLENIHGRHEWDMGTIDGLFDWTIFGEESSEWLMDGEFVGSPMV